MDSEPTHKQKLAVVLWAQGFNAKAIGSRLGVSDKAIYKRLSKVKKHYPDNYDRAKLIRRSHLEAKRQLASTRRYPITGGSLDDALPWTNNETGATDRLSILRKF